MRPLTEIVLNATLPVGVSTCGLRPHDRLLVHIGPDVYDGALVIFSVELPSGSPDRLGAHVLLAGRLLWSAADAEHSSFRSFAVRVRDGDGGIVEVSPGEATVECVIFNRPDLLANLPIN